MPSGLLKLARVGVALGPAVDAHEEECQVGDEPIQCEIQDCGAGAKGSPGRIRVPVSSSVTPTATPSRTTAIAAPSITGARETLQLGGLTTVFSQLNHVGGGLDGDHLGRAQLPQLLKHLGYAHAVGLH